MSISTTPSIVPGWERLRHGGLLFDGTRLEQLSRFVPSALDGYTEGQLRQRANAILDGSGDQARFVAFVLEGVCGLSGSTGNWTRGSSVPPAWGRRAITGETVKPRHLWKGRHGALLPVFVDGGKRLGIGRGRRMVSQVLGWLRAGNDHLALLTNGRQWRLLFAGLDYDAWCEWDLELWFDEGELAPQVTALRTLLNPELWTPESKGAPSRLLQAIRDTRRGQAELSEVLGERVREAVEVLIQAHGEALRALTHQPDVDSARYGEFLADYADVPQDEVSSDLQDVSVGATSEDFYRAACRVAMRLVVVLFAESRDLLPRDNALYHGSYGLNGLFDQLERDGGTLSDSFAAWPRILALFRLVRDGSHHPALPVHAYGGELFAAGDERASDGVSRALVVFEQSCFEDQLLSDHEVRELLRRITRTTIRIRQGRAGVRAVVPVDFSDLSSEYLGILYEGLLDYELKTAPLNDPVVFLSVGDQPALPLSRLEAMDDAALKALFESLKQTKPDSQDEVSEEEPEEDEPDLDIAGADATDQESDSDTDARRRDRTRAETWARRAAQVAGLVRKRRGRDTPERRLAYEQDLADAARRLVARVVLPGEWYLVRWGGTRKGSGSFYTRPGLAVPTVQRTLRPLAYDPPAGADGKPDTLAPQASWTPKPPEQILDLTVCDPACGSGTFPLAALRFLTEALYASLQHHQRIKLDGVRSLVRLFGIHDDERPEHERLADELIPCRPDDDGFEPRLKAVLRRHVVERCIYAVDLDPLAVELCRLSLWIETMDRTLPFGFLDHKVKCGNSLVGAWFDQFQHYPVMAWKNREGGDKNHSNGVHFAKGTRTARITAFVKERLTPDLRQVLEGTTLFHDDLLEQLLTVHDAALAALMEMHAMPVQNAGERARRYRTLLCSPAWRSLKDAMDLWCACWFWPADELEAAPLPSTLAAPSEQSRAVARRIAAELRFFHWELEFPDVFRHRASGFAAILGNPPWENLQPNPEEFFSNDDPLFRTYGRLEKLHRQQDMFRIDQLSEKRWLDYISHFNDISNWVGSRADPFGDPEDRVNNRAFSLLRGGKKLHDRWRSARRRSYTYADPEHPFRSQLGRVFTYRLFLEQSLALMKQRGRFGLIVPSGVYSDSWSRPLRDLLLERCRWEWLFGIENRESIFPIHRSYKFSPLIVEKGGVTETIRTAFMRHKVDDWARAEEFALSYGRAQVSRFSPNNRAILEIQSKQDMDILEKIYANSVLLGDDGPHGWGIKYKLEFMMNTDARLFPPRTRWEASGYRPDEYSRWLLGSWRPIDELWEEMGTDPSKPQPAALELEDWLFDTTAGPERREAEARFVHGHLLKPGDVARTNWRVRCAQPPYDRLPIPRVDIPPGVILSRQGDSWIREEDVEDMALPLYEGRMIGQFDFSQKGWVSGKGRSAVWREILWESKQIEPQFLMSAPDYERELATTSRWSPKVSHMRIGSATNERTAIGSFAYGAPTGDTAATFYLPSVRRCLALTAVFNSIPFDFITRSRVTGLHLDYHVLEQNPLPRLSESAASAIVLLARKLCLIAQWFAPQSLELARGEGECSALAKSERLRLWASLDALVSVLFGLDFDELSRILKDCDRPVPTARAGLDPKGFWRVDKDEDPELRHTVLTLAALHDLEAKIEAADGDRELGIEAFLAQNDGEGWMLPENVRLADYGLGHDDRARCPQVVAGRLGPRFYDWQVAQRADEADRECHFHARNLLGADGYARLLAGLIEGRAGVGVDGLGLLTDRHTRRLLGDDGHVTALVEVRARRHLEDDAYWTAAAALRDGGYPATDCYGALLDQLHARGLLDDAGYRRRSGRNPPGADDTPQLQVAEPGSAYRAATAGDDRQGELFE